jgi:hypothetical protein
MNSTDIDQAHVLVNALKAYPTPKSLCGNKGGDTELHMSGRAAIFTVYGVLSCLRRRSSIMGYYRCYL